MAPYVKVMTPCFGGQVTAAYAHSLLTLVRACERRGIRISWGLQGGDALISRARAECVAVFLNDPEPTHLLFVDADIAFEPEQVFRLLDFDTDFCAAAYPVKSINWQRVAAAVRSGHPDPEAASNLYVPGFTDSEDIFTRNEFMRVPYAGGGFLMIRRPALLRMCTAYSELRYRRISAFNDPLNDSPYRVALFESMIVPETGFYLGEDFSFCRRWTSLGGEIWLDIRSKLTHIGPAAFHGDLSVQFSRLDRSGVSSSQR